MIEMCELGMVKYLLFVFNFLFAVSGLGLIIAGSVILSDVGDFSRFMETRIIAMPILLIIVGIIVFLVAALGCLGAIKESYYALMAFALCLLIIFVVELAVGIAAAVYKGEFQVLLKENLKESLDVYYDSKVDRIAWDNMQINLECCGVDGPEDWSGGRPFSCCHRTKKGAPPPTNMHCNSSERGDEIVYSDGCFDKLQEKANTGAKTLTGVGIGIAFVEIIGVMLACWLANAIKKRDEMK
ncbi:leukocyte surface antigen CD53 [Agrilus planipennis]|uniref:Tetraspanin n=1 Tax=Agrilus planipennis TaxID=224129 RepID=A0A7F5R7Y1_AGRPL|nr:leukocyte surface antigen CD53 [Agrilus planipennis]